MITTENVRQLFDYDPETGVLSWRATGRRAGSRSDRGYRDIKIGRRKWREHRVIWLWMTGRWPEDQIDHENRVRDDNRWANLRVVDQTTNQRNRSLQKNNTSGVPGVSYHKRDRCWRARIKANGEYVHLGSFQTFEDAVAARRAAEFVYDFHPSYGGGVLDL